MLVLTRRALVSRLCLAGAGIICWLSPLSAAQADGSRSNSEHRFWSQLLGERFDLKGSLKPGGTGRATLVLEEASLREFNDDRHRPKNLRPAAISLLFSSSATTVLTSATYTLGHPRLGEVQLFLNRMPCGEYPDSAIYEAVLN